MKILVINTGSSSIKYQLFEMENETVQASGLVEKIGEKDGVLIHKAFLKDGSVKKKRLSGFEADHRQGLEKIVEILADSEYGVIRDKSEISAVGHRVVHGGETFQTPQRITEAVIEEIKKNIPLAPLHNPPNLTGILVAGSIFPNAPQVAVFDTAFHQSLPPKAYLYALPYELYAHHRVRRYGFHGTSHAYVMEKTAEYLGRSTDDLSMISLHLGNGASMAAIENGQCMDTTMGLTPLEGLIMGTRTGDMDPAIPFFLSSHLKMSLNEIDALFNKKSGLKGICGDNDMRAILGRVEKNDDRAILALDLYTYRIKKYIGAYTAVLGRLDALVFTGGIGEKAALVRELSCAGLEKFGIHIDPQINRSVQGGPATISSEHSDIGIFVVPTNEELKIARETLRLLRPSSGLYSSP